MLPAIDSLAWVLASKALFLPQPPFIVAAEAKVRDMGGVKVGDTVHKGKIGQADFCVEHFTISVLQ
jgi:hypothetical protein